MSRIGFVLVATSALALALAGGADTTSSTAMSVKFAGKSHLHPAGQTYSWVCAKVAGTAGAKARVTLSGPGASYPGEKYTKTKRFRKAGTKLFSFKIVLPGRYTFELLDLASNATTTARYRVPKPPKPAQGKFPC